MSGARRHTGRARGPMSEQGFASVEFAILGAVLMTIILAVMEFGRLLYTFSVLNEGTRRAARIAAVCPINDPAIRAAVGFANPPGFGISNVSLTYLDQNGLPIGNPGASMSAIRYVEVQIVGYSHQLMIPFIAPSIDVPPFRATLPRESLGIVNGVTTAC